MKKHTSGVQDMLYLKSYGKGHRIHQLGSLLLPEGPVETIFNVI